MSDARNISVAAVSWRRQTPRTSGLLAWCGLSLLAAVVAGQTRAADPPSDPFASRDVAPGWSLVYIGKGEQRRLERPLQAEFAGGAFTLRTDSGTLFFKRSDEADGFGFVHQPLDGDGSITAKVTRFDDFHQWGGAGVMVRDEIKPLGLYMCAVLEKAKAKDSPDGNEIAASIRMRRKISNEGHRVQQPDRVKLPVWLKVERQAQKVSAFYSADGKDWKLLKEAEFAPTQKVSAGLTAWNRGGKAGTVTFEDVQVHSVR
jgi:regulation of enolase protein 1 (concanavalin A-like superfamily)